MIKMAMEMRMVMEMFMLGDGPLFPKFMMTMVVIAPVLLGAYLFMTEKELFKGMKEERKIKRPRGMASVNHYCKEAR